MKTKLAVLITYDIQNNRNRDKICQALQNMGAIRVQKSVFECYLEKKELKELKKKLKKYRKKNDSIRYYPLCAVCLKNIFRDEKNPELGICNINQIISV